MGGGRDGGANGASHPRAPGGEKQGAALARKVGGGLRNITRERKGGGKKTQRGGKMRCEAPAWSSAALWLSKEKTSAFPLSVC